METSRKKVIELNIEDILPNRFQPRIKFSEDAINELSKSIKEHGVIQPIVVRPIGDKFEIIAGERRYKASCMAGLKTVPALITDLNDKDSAEVALIENVQRENLTPIEEAISYRKILDMGYITQEALATKLGKTQSTIANKLRLLNLDDEVQEALLKEKISERHARSLLKLTDKEQQRTMLNKIIAERLPVRKADEEIDKLLNGGNNMNDETNINESNNSIKEEIKNPFENIIQNTQAETNTFKFINMNQISEDPTTNTEESIMQPEEPSEQNEIKPGKFFNILNEDEPKEEVQEDEFDFNSMFINPIIAEQNSPKNNRLLEELDEIEKSINNSNKKIETTIDNIDESDFEIEDIEEIDDFIEEIKPEITSEPSKIIEKKINEVKENEEIEETEIKEEKIKNNYINIDNNRITNFKDVLQSIRNCSNKIEEAGYVIDTEEYDLEGMYQVVFKITKE